MSENASTCEDHRCYRAAMCARSERVDGEKKGVQIEAEMGLCESCRAHLVDVLDRLMEDYDNLTERIGEPVSADGQAVTYTRDLKVPITLSVEALRADIVHTASTWAEVCAGVMGIEGPGHHQQRLIRPRVLLERSLRTLSGAVSVLLAARDVLVAVWTPEESSDQNRRPLSGTSELLPPPAYDFGYTRKAQWDYVSHHGLDGALRLIELHHQTRRLLGLTKARHRHHLPCPRCEGQLTSAYGSDSVECGSCSFQRTREDYEKLCLLLAERKGA